MDMIAVGIDGAFDLFDGNAGPVGDLEVGPRIGVEQRRLAAVRIADESDSHFLFFRSCRGLLDLRLSSLYFYFASHGLSPLRGCATKCPCPRPGGYCAS